MMPAPRKTEDLGDPDPEKTGKATKPHIRRRNQRETNPKKHAKDDTVVFFVVVVGALDGASR